MSVPIHLETEHFATLVTAMLMKAGKTAFTFTFNEFQDLGLDDVGLESTAVYSDGKPYPDSITVEIVDTRLRVVK